MKLVLSLTALLFASTAFAGPILKTDDGKYQQVSNIMVGGFSYLPGQVCVEGSKLVTTMTKVARFPILDDGETVGYRTKTNPAGLRAEWQTKTVNVKNSDGEIIGKKTFTKKNPPAWLIKTCGSYDAFERDYQGPHRCVSKKVTVQSCDKMVLPPAPAN